MENSQENSSDNNYPSQERLSIEDLTHQAENIQLDETSIESLTANLKQIFDCEGATLFAFDPVRRELFSRNFRSKGIYEIRIDLSLNNLAGFVAATGKPLNIHHVNSKAELSKYHPDLRHDLSWDEKMDFTTRSMLVIPLPHMGKLVGVMEIINKNGGHFSDADFLKARLISPIMGLALVKLEDQEPLNGQSIKQKNELEEKLHNFSHAIHSTGKVDDILTQLRDPFLKLFDAQGVALYTIDPDNDELVCKIKSGAESEEVHLLLTRDHALGFSAAEQRLINLMDASDQEELKRYSPDMHLDRSWDETTGLHTRSTLIMPLVYKGKLKGIFQLVNKENEDGFTAQDENMVFIIAESLSLAIDNHEKFVDRKPSKFDYLMRNEFLSEEELIQMRARSRKRGIDIETLLISDLYLRPSDVGKSLEKYYLVPFTGYDETIDLPDPEDLGLNYEELRKDFWVPLKYNETDVVILINEPNDKEVTGKIHKTFPDKNAQFRFGLKSHIQDYIQSMFGKEKILHDSGHTTLRDAEPEEDIHESSDPVEKISSKKSEPVETTDTIATPPAARVFNEILNVSYNQKVTDIHIEPGPDNQDIRVRLRKDGVCRVYKELPGALRTDLIAYIKALVNLDIEKSNLPQSGSREWVFGSVKLGLDVVTLPVIGNVEDIMIRLNTLAKPVPSYIPLEESKVSSQNFKKINYQLTKTTGMILVSGPQGSGKTTMLHSLLGQLNSSEKKILTVEDPVEIVQDGLRQTQINPEVGFDYSSALKMFQLGNPDVIMAGEITNIETFRLIAEAANHHLLMSSLNSETALDSIRIQRELGMDQQLFSDRFLMVVTQRFVKQLCQDCKESYHPSKEQFDFLAELYGGESLSEIGIQYNEDLSLMKPGGCPQCLYSGYSGPLALQEILEGLPEIKRLIAANAPLEEIEAKAIQEGMSTLVQDGVYKVFEGLTDFKEIQAAFSPNPSF